MAAYMPTLGGPISENLMRIAPRITKVIAQRWGDRFPFWYVSEYPRSGGTWLAKMIASYLDLPVPQFAMAPIAFPAVIHNHWVVDRRLRRVVYLYRDGRDVMVSAYFFRMAMLSDRGRSRFAAQMHRRYSAALGADFDPQDIRRNLGRFIELEMEAPRGSRINWPDHVKASYEPGREGVAYISYERLLSEPVESLIAVLSNLGVDDVNRERVQSAVDRYSFQRMTGRESGSEERWRPVRKGVAGDWRNHFTREAAEIFVAYAGQTLIELDYESSTSWVSACS